MARVPEPPHPPTRRSTGRFRPGRRLFLVVVALSAVLAVVGSSIAWEAYDRDRSRARADMIAVARTAATVADRALRHRIALLAAIAASPPLSRGDTRATRAYLESLELDPGTFSGGIGLVGADGRLEVVTGRPSSGPSVELGDRPHVRWVLAHGKPYVGATVASRLTGVLLLPVSVPVRDRSGRISGVLVGTMRPDSSSVLRPLRFLSSDLVVVDRTGRVFDARSGGSVPVENRPVLRRLRAQGTGFLTPARDLRNRPHRAVAFATAEHGGWVVLVNRPVAEVFGAPATRLRRELAALAAAVLLALLGSAWAGRSLDRAAREREERRWYERRLERAVSQLAAATSAGRVIEIALDTASDVLPLDTGAAVVRVSGSRERFRLLQSAPEDAVTAPLLAAPAIGRALETGLPEWGDPARGEALVLPLSTDHGIVAALSWPATRAEQSFAHALVDRAGTALARVRLYEDARQAERALRAQTGLLEAIANATNDLIYAKGLDGRFVMLNDATASMLGTTVAEALGRSEADFLPPERIAAAVEAERRAAAGGGRVEPCERRLSRNGEDRVFTSTTSALRDEDGVVIGTVTVAHDVTDRVRIEQQRTDALARERATRRRVELLQAVTTSFAEAATPAEIARAIVQETPEALGAMTTVVLLEDEGELKRYAASGLAPEDLERWKRIPLDAALPSALAHRSGETVVIEARDLELRRFPALEAAAGMWRSALFVPMCHERRRFGVAGWGFAVERTFDDDFLRLADAIASQAALALERARLFEAEHGIAVGLQRSLLPSRLGATHGAQVAVRYQAGAEQLEVGGDWYEVLELPTARIGLVVGDVVGRGLRAAAAMGQLRSAVSALALVTPGPGRLLEGIESFASRTDGAEFATVVIAVLDPVTGLLRYSCAAHPPPLVVHPDGDAYFLQDGRSPPLCALGGEKRPEAAVHLPPGATLVLYTDGLVERRGASLETGLLRLRIHAAASAGLPIEEFGDAIVEHMRDDEISDDIALLVARLDGAPAGTLSLSVPGTPDQLRVLRKELRRWLRARSVPRERADEVVLAAGEAVANAVEHAYAGGRQGAVDLTAWPANGEAMLCLEVRDRGEWRDPGVDVDRGRGLAIMRGLLDSVEVVRTARGTTVSMTKLIPEHELGNRECGLGGPEPLSRGAREQPRA